MTAMHTLASRRNNGATLVELMVTLAVMSVAMAIVASTLILVERATNQIEHSSVAVDAARLVSASLDRELRSADCISEPGENIYSDTLTFDTTINTKGSVTLTYKVIYGDAPVSPNGIVTRAEGLGAPRTVITEVGPAPKGTDGLRKKDPITGQQTEPFKQVNTPLRTLVIDIPIQSDNGGIFNLLTTIAGRNSWRRCTPPT